MPIMTEVPHHPEQPIVTNPVKTQPKSFKGVTVDTKKTPRSTLTTYLEGQSWVVDYYARVSGRDTSIGGLQVGLNEVYQQYKLVRGFEFKVTSPLSTSQNDESKEMSLVGSSNVYGVLIPNDGDMFIADVGDGQEGLFQVTSTRRKTIYAETAHEIEYKMISYNREATALDLTKKVVETVYFNRDYLREGYAPLLHEETVNLTGKLENHYSRLIAMYFNDFFSREHNTLLVPNQERVTYDPFLVKFITNIIGTDEHPHVRQIKQLNVSNDQAMYEMSLWNCLETMDYDLLPIVAQEMGIVPVRHFYSRPMFNSIYYSRVESVIYPLQYQTNVDAGYREIGKKQAAPLLEGATRFRELKRLIHQTVLITDTDEGPYLPAEGLDAPEIRRVTEDSYYVFTERFYNYDTRDGDLSLLENMVRKALKGESLDLNVLDQLCTSSKRWDNVERFYYLPILFVLLRIYPRGL